MGNITRRWTIPVLTLVDPLKVAGCLIDLPCVISVSTSGNELYVTYRAALRHDWSQARYHDIDSIIGRYGGTPTMANVQCYRCSAAITVGVEYANSRNWCDDCIRNAPNLEKLP